MLTKINYNIDEGTWITFFHDQEQKLELSTTAMGIITTKDGFVYYKDGVYALTDSNNKAFEVIISVPTQLGITIIDTSKISATHKILTRQLVTYLTLLHEFLIRKTKDKVFDIITYNDRTINEIKEKIIVEHSI
tara:strand:+ start:145 stop:546 length:402 start_codon:yes stop_codon:yes gene_type:complete